MRILGCLSTLGAGCYLSVLYPYLLGPLNTTSTNASGLDLVWLGCLAASVLVIMQAARQPHSLYLKRSFLVTAAGCFFFGSFGDALATISVAIPEPLMAFFQLLRGGALVSVGLFWIIMAQNMKLDRLLFTLGCATLLALFLVALAMTGLWVHVVVALLAGFGGAISPLKVLRKQPMKLLWENVKELSEDNNCLQPSEPADETTGNPIREFLPALSSTTIALMLFIIIFHAQPQTLQGAFFGISLSDSFCGMALAAILTVLATLLFGRQLTVPVVQWAIFPLVAGFLLICNSFPLESFLFRLGIVAMFVFFALMGLFAFALMTKVSARGNISPAFTVVIATVCLLVSVWIGQALATSGLTADERGEILCSLAATYYVMILLTPIAQLWLSTRNDCEESTGGIISESRDTLELRCVRIGEHYQLSPREQEILFYIGQGYTSSYIAEVLYISSSTVRTHMKAIYRKTGVNSKTDIIDLVNKDRD